MVPYLCAPAVEMEEADGGRAAKLRGCDLTQ